MGSIRSKLLNAPRKLYYRALEYKRALYLRQLVRKGLVLGRDVAIVGEVFLDPAHCFLISIGDHCTLAPRVRLIAHDASSKRLLGFSRIGKIEIREHCFLGDSVIVLPGVTIGPRAIVGAGSVVTSDIPEGSVAAGNPARVLCSVQDYEKRLEEERRDKPVFGPEHTIDRLDARGRATLRAAVADGDAYIV